MEMDCQVKNLESIKKRMKLARSNQEFRRVIDELEGYLNVFNQSTGWIFSWVITIRGEIRDYRRFNKIFYDKYPEYDTKIISELSETIQYWQDNCNSMCNSIDSLIEIMKNIISLG